MKVPIPCGRKTIDLDLPFAVSIIQSPYVPGLSDEAGAIRSACRNPIGCRPLQELAGPSDTVAIVHTDITRATPNDRILPVLLAELEAAGVSDNNITLLNALGTHRPQTDTELRAMLGDQIVERYRCEQHNCLDADDLVVFGTTSRGNLLRVNRRLAEASVKILTGFIEPHFFAGFSGGPKAILPAMAGRESVLSNHGREMIAHSNASWGITEGNPIWEEMREAAVMLKPTFLLNVTLNRDHQITGVFAGDMLVAHKQGCEFVRGNAMVKLDRPYDVVIASNNGYPLDQNLYQCVKGMSAANRIVCEGGDIIMVVGCEDGLPDHGRYAELLKKGGSPQGVLNILNQPGFGELDQWQVQVQANIQLRANVYVHSPGLTDAQINEALCQPCANVAGFLERRFINKPNSESLRVAVMPEGPQTIAYIA